MRSIATVRRRLDNLVESRNLQQFQHISFQGEETLVYGGDKVHAYIPTTTGALFHDDNTFIRLIMGPYGSGKTTLAIHEIVRRTASMPYWFNGRRRARWAIVRNTSGELYSTTLASWLTWFGNLGDIQKRQKPLLTYEHHFNDGKGIIELELIFIALDREEDVRKIKSLEVTGCYINELCEVPEAALTHFKGRVNHRYPSEGFCKQPYWSGIIADTNPPDEDHWIYRDFEVNITPSYKIFHQPSGLLEGPDGFLKDDDGNYIQNPNCDNAAHLHHDYYVKLAEKQSEGFIKVYCGGKYGLVEKGKRVYPEYNADIHSVARLEAIEGLPLHLGWDFGLTPACIVIQFTARGQFRLLKEYLAEDMGIRTFAKNIVIPGLAQDFPGFKIGKSVADPAGAAGDQIMEELSCISELNNLGISTYPASTNDPGIRIDSVKYFLNTMVDGHPCLLLSREGCPVTHKGFVNGYHYKRLQVLGEERYQDKPYKNKFSHPHDTVQYVALEFAAERIHDKKEKPNTESIYNPVMRLF